MTHTDTDSQSYVCTVYVIISGSQKARSLAPFLMNISYGETAKQKLDMLDLDQLPKGEVI